MGALILPSKFTQQPQAPGKIDRSNPLAAGLTHAYLGYAQYDAAPEAMLSAMMPPKVVQGGVEFSAVNASLYRLATAQEKSSSFTVAVLVRSLGDSTAFAAISGITYDNAGNAPYGDQIDRGGDGKSLRFAFNVNGNAVSTAPSGNLIVGVDEWLFATFTSGSQALYRQNGGLIGSTTSSGAPSYTSTSLLNIGPSTNDGRNINLVVKASLRWGRVLSQSEMNAVMSNAWQLAKAPPRRLWVAASSGANTQVIPAAGTVVLSGTAPTVSRTATQSVVPSQGAMAFAGYAPTVSQSSATAITPSAGSIAFSGYAPSISRTLNQSVSPAVRSIAIAGYSPSVVQIPVGVISPVPGVLALQGFPPNVSRSANQGVAPNLGQLSFAGYAPTIFQGLVGVTPNLNVYALMYESSANILSTLGDSININGNLL